jgi:hypothetical protein
MITRPGLGHLGIFLGLPPRLTKTYETDPRTLASTVTEAREEQAAWLALNAAEPAWKRPPVAGDLLQLHFHGC